MQPVNVQPNVCSSKTVAIEMQPGLAQGEGHADIYGAHVGSQLPVHMARASQGSREHAPQAGALLAGAWFGALPPARIFGIAAAFNLAGAALTAVFVPDVLGLDLSDGDARWEALKTGQPYAVRGRLVARLHGKLRHAMYQSSNHLCSTPLSLVTMSHLLKEEGSLCTTAWL